MNLPPAVSFISTRYISHSCSSFSALLSPVLNARNSPGEYLGLLRNGFHTPVRKLFIVRCFQQGIINCRYFLAFEVWPRNVLYGGRW
eukprot:IDg11280t1